MASTEKTGLQECSPVSAPEADASVVNIPKADNPKIKNSDVDSTVTAADMKKIDTPHVDAPKGDTPMTESSKLDTPKVDAQMIYTPKVDTPKIDLPEPDTSKANTLKVEISSADVPKEFTPKFVMPKPSSTAKSIAPAKKLKAEASVASPAIGDENASVTVEMSSLKLDEIQSPGAKFDHSSSRSDALFSNEQGLGWVGLVPITEASIQSSSELNLVAKPVIEEVVISTLKPKADENKNHKSVAEEKAFIETTTSPSVSSKSQGGVNTDVEVDSKPKKKIIKKKQKRRSPFKTDPEHSTLSLNTKESSETLISSFMIENSEHFVTARSSPNPSLTSGPSDACLCPSDRTKVNSAAEANMSKPLEKKYQDAVTDSKSDSNTSAGSTPKSAAKTGKKSLHSKRDSNTSTVSTSSVRKVDKKSKKSNEKKESRDENVKFGEKNLNQSQKENQSSSPAVNLSDATQWPTLGAGKTPVLSDGKAPAGPALQPLVDRKKNPNAPIIPAVPLNMQRRRPS